MFAGSGTELFDSVLPDFAEEYSHSLEMPLGQIKLKVLPLERILTSKKAANRLKDKLVIPVLEDSLAATKQPRRKS